MAIIRQDRINNENINSINDIEEYINTNYLQLIQDRIEALKLKKQELEDKLALYNSLNNSNNIFINDLLSTTKYTTITNNQTVAEPLINNINKILKQLTAIIDYKNIITFNNLSTKEDLYNVNKVSIVDGEFKELQCSNPKTLNGIVNRDYFDKELLKIEVPPKPLQPLRYLTTDGVGNKQWR